MTDKERLDWLEETRTQIQSNWHYEKGYIVRLGIHEGTGKTFRDAFDCAMEIMKIRRSRWY